MKYLRIKIHEQRFHMPARLRVSHNVGLSCLQSDGSLLTSQKHQAEST